MIMKDTVFCLFELMGSIQLWQQKHFLSLLDSFAQLSGHWLLIRKVDEAFKQKAQKSITDPQSLVKKKLYEPKQNIFLEFDSFVCLHQLLNQNQKPNDRKLINFLLLLSQFKKRRDSLASSLFKLRQQQQVFQSVGFGFLITG